MALTLCSAVTTDRCRGGGTAVHGFLCHECYEALNHAIEFWSQHKDTILALQNPVGDDISVQRSIVHWYLIPAARLDVDEVESILSKHQHSLDDWIRTVTGAEEALKLLWLIGHYARKYRIISRTGSLRNTRCPECGTLTLIIREPSIFETLFCRCITCGWEADNNDYAAIEYLEVHQ